MSTDVAAGHEIEVKSGLEVFISHKHTDRRAAQKLADDLYYESNELQPYVSGGVPGIDWRSTVYEKLKSADCLVLLYTDQYEEWDWCLYESGFFDALKHLSKPDLKLFVLHRSTTPIPSPLEIFHSIPVDDTDDGPIVDFLRQLYDIPPREGVPPLSPRLFRDTEKSKNDLKYLVDAVRRSVGVGEERREEFSKQIQIQVDSTDALRRTGDIPNNATVYGSFELFGKRIAEARWHEVKSWMERLDREARVPWIRRLTTLIEDIIDGNIIKSFGLPLFKAADGEVYRPMLHSFRESADGSLSFHLVFADLPKEIDAVSSDINITRVMRVMNIGRMFRWGAIVPFVTEVLRLTDSPGNHQELEKVYMDFRRRMGNIVSEAEANGYKREDVAKAFPRNNGRSELIEVMNAWDLIFKPSDEYMGKSKLEHLVFDHDFAGVKALTEEMLDVSKRWLVAGSSRFAELSSQLELD